MLEDPFCLVKNKILSIPAADRLKGDLDQGRRGYYHGLKIL